MLICWYWCWCWVERWLKVGYSWQLGNSLFAQSLRQKYPTLRPFGNVLLQCPLIQQSSTYVQNHSVLTIIWIVMSPCPIFLGRECIYVWWYPGSRWQCNRNKLASRQALQMKMCTRSWNTLELTIHLSKMKHDETKICKKSYSLAAN